MIFMFMHLLITRDLKEICDIIIDIIVNYIISFWFVIVHYLYKDTYYIGEVTRKVILMQY